VPLQGGKKNVLHFPEDTLKSWPNLEDVEIVICPHHAWVVNILPLASVDEETQVAHTAKRIDLLQEQSQHINQQG